MRRHVRALAVVVAWTAVLGAYVVLGASLAGGVLVSVALQHGHADAADAAAVTWFESGRWHRVLVPCATVWLGLACGLAVVAAVTAMAAVAGDEVIFVAVGALVPLMAYRRNVRVILYTEDM